LTKRITLQPIGREPDKCLPESTAGLLKGLLFTALLTPGFYPEVKGAKTKNSI